MAYLVAVIYWLSPVHVSKCYDLHCVQSAAVTYVKFTKIEQTKCWSLSICSGVPKVVDFHIDGKRVTPVKEDPQRFLGSLITHSCSQKDVFDMISDKFYNSLNNIDPVRDNFKIAIFGRYFMPSMHFCLTVHELTKANVLLCWTETRSKYCPSSHA